LLAAAGETLAAASPPTAALSAEQSRQLASLGYLGGAGAAPAVAADLPDPRERVGVAAELHAAAGRIQRGECAGALRDLERIVRDDPHNFPALTLAGQCLRDAGRHAEALALYQRAARENELSAVPVVNSAGCLLALGRAAEAEREFRHALVLDPSLGDAAVPLSRLLRESGRAAEAAAVLDRALAAGALAPAVFLERGLGHAEAGRLEPALADFREAARRAPTDPLPLENAARASFALGRAREAAILYETLLRLAPDRGDVWKTLGAVYLEALDDRAQALRAFRAAYRLESDPAERARLEAVLAGLGG
jgi:tetratricopeptide (TPR) repeat protein